MSYTPQFHEQEQTPALRWKAVRSAIYAGASDRAVPSHAFAQLQLRFIAGEIDQVQVQDEVLRWYRPDIAPATDVRPLPPEQPGRVYPYAAEMAALMQDMNELPPYVPYTVMPEGLPWLDSYPRDEAAPTQPKAHFGYLVDIIELDFTTRVEVLHTTDTGSPEYEQLRALGHECTYSDGTDPRAGILQNSIDTKAEFIELCRIIDPALAKAEGWA